MGDNVGQRGLKYMLGGTELNLKKEKNQMEELLREDWMSKPLDDMTDEKAEAERVRAKGERVQGREQR